MLGSRWQVGTRTGDTTTADVVASDRIGLRLSSPLLNHFRFYCHLKTARKFFRLTLLSSTSGTNFSEQSAVFRLNLLSRLRAIRPKMITWGLSATLSNLNEAIATLVGPRRRDHAKLIEANTPRKLEFSTIIPNPIERFPWAGHMGYGSSHKLLRY